MGRGPLSAAVIAVALLLQVAVINRLPLPGGVTPDVVLLTVAALALVNGSTTGMVAGFFAGLAADIVPPADHSVGRYAFTLCLVGFFCGRAEGVLDHSSLLPFGVLAAAALGGSALYAGLGVFIGDPRVTWASVGHVLPLSVVYALIVSPFVLYLVTRVFRRFNSEEPLLTVRM